MIKEIREEYNRKFTEERYEAFTKEMNTTYKYPVDFRLAETPIFLTKQFTEELYKACDEILASLQSPEFMNHATSAIPKGLSVPNETPHTTFLQIDFAIATDESGKIVPRLIELQGFPSLYGFQIFQDEVVRKHFSIPDPLVTYFNGLNETSYTKLLKDTIVGTSDPKSVILLEIEPEKQKTRIDFVCTEKYIGLEVVSLTDVFQQGNRIFYIKDGKTYPIERIYNRVIFDELQQRTLDLKFHMTDEVDVEWVGHPNWFFKISKHTLPFFKSQYVPSAHFLSDVKEYPTNLSEYVLKPLYSFAGAGVEVEVTPEMLNNIKQKENYILQKKITYAPCIATPDGFSKAEIRMMFIWNEKPLLVNNLVRLSKGAMMGVNFNKNKTWVGSSLAFHY